MNARSQAIAASNREIDESKSRAIAARAAESRPPNALESMAKRLQITPAGLKHTLLNTVFAECKNDEQFMALVVVSNEFGLNPLTKEIYAFPAKGGGIVPMVSVDGWIRLMNEHPAFDGIEFDYHADAKGNTQAIEAIIYRKDRNRPVKVIEYMDECKGNTQPWQKSPRRMLRHRALIQGVRVAFGFSGIAGEGDEAVIDGGDLTPQQQSVPSRQSFAQDLDDEIPAFDKQTGEVFEKDASGRTVEDEETARALDAGNDGTLSDDNPTAAEGPADEQRGEALADDKPAWFDLVAEIRAGLNAAKTKTYFAELDAKFTNARAGLPDDVITELDKLSAAARKRVANSEV